MMSNLHTKIAAEITVLSPLHIGSGTKLKQDFDWLTRDEQVYVFDQHVLFETVLKRAEKDQAGDIVGLTTILMEMTLTDLEQAGWLEKKDFRQPDNPLFLYILRSTPHLKEINEQIKDVRGHPYLPGSSLKGALRTILAWGVYANTKLKLDLRRLKSSRSWAAQPLEKVVFGPDPNRDWLRALQVTDGPPLSPDSLRLEGVRVYPTARRHGGPGLDLDVETICQNTNFTVPLTIDEYGFQAGNAQQLGWSEQRQWLNRLAELGREHARQRLLTEAEYFNTKGGPVGAMRFYDNLIHTWSELKENEFIAQVGWGGGWDSKTLDGLLKQNERAFEQHIIKNPKYRMTRRGTRRKPGDPFPTSRRLVLQNGEPALPMGWVKVKLAELGG